MPPFILFILDTGDATLMQRMLAGLDPPRAWDQLLNDLNGSATLDSGDVIRTLRAVTGADPQPGPPAALIARQVAAAGAEAGLPQALLAPAGPRALLDSPQAHGAPGGTLQVAVRLADMSAPISGAAFTLDYPVAATFVSQPLPYDAWLLAHFSLEERADPLVSGWDADPDGNGFDNGSEYNGGTNPRAPESAPVLDALRIPDASGSAFLEVRLTQNLRAIDGTTWESTRNDNPTTRILEISVDHGAGTRVLAFRSTTSLADSPRQFLRLIFTSP